jgi:molecular chaperone HscC
MAQAERMWEDHVGEARQAIGLWITEFAGALDTQEPRHIAEARHRLEERLAMLGGHTVL